MSDNCYIKVFDWMSEELHLSGSELLIYAMVASFPNGWHGSYSSAAVRIGIDRRNVIEVFRRLVSKGLLMVTKHHHSNIYKVVTNHHYDGDETSLPMVMKHHQDGDETSPNNKDILNTKIKNNISAKNQSTPSLPAKRKEEKSSAKKEERFIKPSIDEVARYILEKGWSVNADRWYAHYESVGWKVGKAQMKDWRAAVKTWQYNNFNNQKNDSYDNRKFTAGQSDFVGCDTI